MTKTSQKSSGDTADRFMDLVRRFPLRPIRTKGSYAEAARVLGSLLARDAHLNMAESDYAQTLALLVREYDLQHASILKEKKGTPIEMLKFLMEQHDMNVTALGEVLGSGSGQASLVLAGKRELSKANIRTLAKRFSVSPAIFL